MYEIDIPEPFRFNPMKHHLGYLRSFTMSREDIPGGNELLKELKHTGSSVMDVYSGHLPVKSIHDETACFLHRAGLTTRELFCRWTGTANSDFRTIILSDESQWIMKYQDHEKRYVHIFPARYGPHTFRIKANTLRSAILYINIIGKDFVTEEDLNMARSCAGLSPVKDVAEAEAISEMIELLRN